MKQLQHILPILGHYLRTKYGRQFHSREQLLAWQDQQVRQFLTEILPKSPFYQRYYQGLEIANWQQFPLIDKARMMENFDTLNTVGIKKSEAFALALEAERSRNFKPTLGDFTVGLSSGTSGNRGLFLISKKEQQQWAGAILAKGLPQCILHRQRIAFFLRANSKLYETVQSNRIQFEYFDLFQSPESHLPRLNQYAPTILVAPPSMLRLLAEAKKRGDLQINPNKIIAVAEVLDPLDKAYIEQSFGNLIHQFYQCTEGFLGYTCPHGTLHLNEDILVIQKEYLDPQSGKFIPIITDFNRTSQPIIRYRLDDILTERRTPCPCGSVFTALESIEGRQDDIFYLPSQTGSQLVPVFPDFIRRAIILASEEIVEYRVVQPSPNSLEIFLKVPPELQDSVRTQVTQGVVQLCERSHCQVPQIDYPDYQAHTEPHQKLRRVQRRFRLET